MAADWTREEWLAYADRLIAGGLRHLSPGGGQVRYPGAEGGYGAAVDGLEGFTRTLLIVGFRIAGERGRGVDHLIDFCVRGVTTGVDPDAPDRWVRLTEHAQAKVEAASIALVLDLTREWVWERLDETTRARLIDYLAPVVGDETYPRTNWLWFRVVVQTFLRSVGGPWSADDVRADLALHDSLVRADGWVSDGVERSYDHYVGWALHLYPVLWSRMTGAADLAEGRTPRDLAALDRYLDDALTLVGADGSPLVQGRSLIYRFAAAAPFWAGVLAGATGERLGQLRHAASLVVSHFDAHGVPGADDVLDLGWHGSWPALAQSYSGPGSPYWAAKGLLGIALPADHPVWNAAPAPLPVETGDVLRAIAAPGWLVSGTAADGIVRVVNHGTDHAVEGTPSADSPFYARLGYSTATSPLLDEEAWLRPLEQSVTLVTRDGRATHRSGMRLTAPRVVDGVGVAASSWQACLLDPAPTAHRHGSGLPGRMTRLGDLDTVSLVRGAWELRLVRVHALADEPVGVRVGGWPVAGKAVETETTEIAAIAASPAVTSTLRPLTGDATLTIERRESASPLGPHAAVPVAELPATPGQWQAVLVGLTATRSNEPVTATLRVQTRGHTLRVHLTWPDGHPTVTDLPDPRHVGQT